MIIMMIIIMIMIIMIIILIMILIILIINDDRIISNHSNHSSNKVVRYLSPRAQGDMHALPHAGFCYYNTLKYYTYVYIVY